MADQSQQVSSDDCERSNLQFGQNFAVLRRSDKQYL